MTREEALEILQHNWTRVENPNYSNDELDEAYYMAIEALSAERPKGEWIKTDKCGMRKCSCCGIELMVYAQGNYCPNCGAKMTKGDDTTGESL